MRRVPCVLALAVVVLGLCGTATGGNVVGLRGAHQDVYLAVRGFLAAGTVVTGITFYSNDATSFPQVLLAADGGESRPPRWGTVLRSPTDLSGQRGYVTIEFTPYVVPVDQYLWAIVQFPDDSPIEVEGLGGGPGIGWRLQGQLPRERSLFSVSGLMNEFMPALDISLVTTAESPEKTAKEARGPSSARKVFDVYTYRNAPKTGVVFAVRLQTSQRVVVDAYNVVGRHVVTIQDRHYRAGEHRIVWDARDKHRIRVPSGVYLFTMRAGEQRSTAKLILVR